MSVSCEFLLLYLVALKAVRKSEILGLSLDGPPSPPTFFSVTYCMNLVILLFWIFFGFSFLYGLVFVLRSEASENALVGHLSRHKGPVSLLLLQYVNLLLVVPLPL